MMPMAHRKKAEAARLAWKHPLGTLVNVRKDNGSTLATKTRSDPWVLGGTAVIMVEGISGGYSLDRVTVRTE